MLFTINTFYQAQLDRFGLWRAILCAAALSLALVSLVMPWLTIKILGELSLSPLDILRSIFIRNDTGATNSPQLTQALTAFTDSFAALTISMIVFPLAVGSLIVGLVSTRFRDSALIGGGFNALLSATSWIYCVESLKSHAFSDASSAGGFGQLLGTALSSTVQIGPGAYLLIAAGIIALSGYFIKDSMVKAVSNKS